MKKLFLCAAAAMLALVGCEKQVQSSISLADVDMVAHIKGTLVFDAAQAGINTKVDTLANQRVYFIVNANLYDADANPTDKRSFEATTDSHGQFDITVPAGSKEIAGELRTDVIKLDLEGGKTIYLKETKKDFKVYAGDNKFDKIICYVDELLSACQGKATVNGRVVYDPGIITKNGHKEKGVLAAVGANVCVLARYDQAGLSENLGTDSVKLFTIKTDENGFFTLDLPVSNDNTKAVPVEVTVSNFDAKYIDEINGNEVPRDAKFAKSAAINENLKDGEFKKIADPGAEAINLERVWIAPITTATTTFKVKGELKLSCEEYTYGTGDYSNMITGVQDGTTEYTNKINGGAFQLEVKHIDPASGDVLSTIILDCNTKADGSFDQDVTVYDDWKSDDIEIYLNIKKFVVSNYSHIYKGAIYKSGKWDEYPTVWCDYDDNKKKINKNYADSQDCPGSYEYKGGKQSWDGTFDVNVGTLVAKFTMDPSFIKNELLGVGNIVNGVKIDFEESDQTHQIAGEALTYPRP